MYRFSEMSQLLREIHSLSMESNQMELIALLEDFPASRSVSQANGKGKPTSDSFGENLIASLEKLDRVGLLLKTYLDSSVSHLTTYLPIWKVKATGASRLYIQLRLSVRPTDGKGSSLWPTATSQDYKDGTTKSCANVPVNCLLGRSVPLGKLCPTPDCSDRRSAKSKQQGLSNAVKGQNWPTPREFMYKDSTTDRNKSNIGEKVGGQLNPDWVEILMGFPVGWTDIDCEEPLPWPGWPALMGQPQYDYEPPRVATKSRNRTKRLKCLGNAVVPQQAYPIFQIIADIHRASLLFKVKTWED